MSVPHSGWSNGFIDYNNDGWKDIYSANGDVDQVNESSPQHDTMFENVDGKTFIDCRTIWARISSPGLSTRFGIWRPE